MDVRSVLAESVKYMMCIVDVGYSELTNRKNKYR